MNIKLPLILSVAACMALSACSVLQTQVNTAVDQALALALPDLDAAHAVAVAKHDPNPAHDMCWTGLATAIRAKQAADASGTASADTAPVGLASAAEDLLLTNVAPLVILAPLPPDVKSACYATIGELQVKANIDALKMSASVTATLRSLKL